MNKLLYFFFIFLILTYSSLVYGKKIKLQPLVVIKINHLLDLSVDQFYTETLASTSQFTGTSLLEIQKATKALLSSAKFLPPETAVHFKKIFQTLNVQLSLLLKTSKIIYMKQVWKSLFVISRTFNVKAYFYGFCAKDRSMWLQKKKTKPVNPIGARSCVNFI